MHDAPPEGAEGQRRLLWTCVVVLGLASFGTLALMVATGVERVNTSGDTGAFRIAWFVSFNWVAFLASLAVFALALAAGLWLRYVEWRELVALRRRLAQRP